MRIHLHITPVLEDEAQDPLWCPVHLPAIPRVGDRVTLPLTPTPPFVVTHVDMIVEESPMDHAR